MMELPSLLLESHITRGSILHSTIFEEIDHGKFFVIIGVNQDNIAGFFYINSNIHPAIYNKPDQFAMQYQIRRSDYPFLKYDSFISATSLTIIPRQRLSQSLNEGSSEFVDVLKEPDLEALLEACRESKLFSNVEKRDYFY